MTNIQINKGGSADEVMEILAKEVQAAHVEEHLVLAQGPFLSSQAE